MISFIAPIKNTWQYIHNHPVILRPYNTDAKYSFSL